MNDSTPTPEEPTTAETTAAASAPDPAPSRRFGTQATAWSSRRRIPLLVGGALLVGVIAGAGGTAIAAEFGNEEAHEQDSEHREEGDD
ncbi:hypothetical protein GCM10022223_33650 [Kineosporia mesophila]|uniref:Uncharacterized protein n=1 Tax=Kineosporia mesophila TaxID=566012 RepID=A0ABP6ZRX2_9ACTN|nr:hypothetical protein [Kineosporia mesophila]MCD5353650.1 hypothetical protein [Kineosporia mesophila]